MNDDGGAREERRDEADDKEAQRHSEGEVEGRIVDYLGSHETDQDDECIEGSRGDEPAQRLGSHEPDEAETVLQRFDSI